MKLSKYTLFHKHENKIYIYHQVSNALFEIDNELVNALNAPNLPSEIPDDILSSLKMEVSLLMTIQTRHVISVMQIL